MSHLVNNLANSISERIVRALAKEGPTLLNIYRLVSKELKEHLLVLGSETVISERMMLAMRDEQLNDMERFNITRGFADQLIKHDDIIYSKEWRDQTTKCHHIRQELVVVKIGAVLDESGSM